MKEKETVIFAGNCCTGPSISIPVMPEKPLLAHAYVPYQVYMGILPVMEGFKKGTVFNELYQPYAERKEELWMKSHKQANLPEINKQLPTKQMEKANTLINEKYIRGTVFPDSSCQ
ncbi:MAG: spore coat associated protein CotJA [Clostridiaceae bacterium]|nr:spore coat associated protein CotJA [Clostridiaceae bacterium]